MQQNQDSSHLPSFSPSSLPKPVSHIASLITSIGLGVWASGNSGAGTEVRILLAIVAIASIGLVQVKWHGIAFALFTMGSAGLPMALDMPNTSHFILTGKFAIFYKHILLQSVFLIACTLAWFCVVSYWLKKNKQTQKVDSIDYRPIGIGDRVFHSLAGGMVLSFFLYFFWRLGHTQESPNQYAGMTLLGVWGGSMVIRTILPDAGIVWLIVAPLVLNTIWAIYLSITQSPDDIIDAWLNHQPLLNPIAALPSITLSCTLIGLSLAIGVTNSVNLSKS